MLNAKCRTIAAFENSSTSSLYHLRQRDNLGLTACTGIRRNSPAFAGQAMLK